MDITRSIYLIEEHGSNLEKASLRYILYGEKPGPAILKYFTTLQNPDGGFPCNMTQGNPSAIHKTQYVLSQMDDLGMLQTTVADNAFHYLLAAQISDGGWDEQPSIMPCAPPPWAIPGDLWARLYLSALSAFWLAVRGETSQPAFHKALEFLLKYQDATGKFYGFLHTTWIAVAVFLMADSQYDEIAEKGLQALSARPVSEWVDSQIAWALDCLSLAGLPKDHPFVEQSLETLFNRQQTNGRWLSEDGEAHEIGVTLEILKVLKRYDLLVSLQWYLNHTP
jgi:hypothetical protein